MTALSPLHTLAQIADYLHVSPRTVRRLVASGQLRAIKVGRRPLVTEKELHAYVAAAFRAA